MDGDESAARDTTTDLAEEAKEKGRELQQQAGDRLRSQIATRSNQAGEQVRAIGQALRETGGHLREQGQETPARITDQTAERLDSAGSYLLSAGPDRLLADAEDFARRNPWTVAAAAAAVGFAASRFLKASSEGRYRASSEGGYRPVDLRPYEQEGTEPYQPRHAGETTSSLPTGG
jgi:ElaB/YqjD/DUF883 family membrane-anchored ribosome-binding protein